MANAVIEAKQGEVIGTESLFANENENAEESIEEVVANSDETAEEKAEEE